MKSNKGFFAAAAGFIKKYIYFILLFFCVAAIAIIIVVATTGKKPSTLPPEGGNNQEDPGPEIPAENKPMEFSLPVKDYSLGNDFSFTDFVWLATHNRWQTHKGIDFKAAAGTNVYAVYDGTVDSIYTNIFEGTVVVLKHKDGVKTIYKSLDSEVSVRAGDTVRTNDVIGKVSDSMMYEIAEGPHLHFEVWQNDKMIDPYIYLLELAK